MSNDTNADYCEFCGSGPTCGVCGRDDNKKAGNLEAALQSFSESLTYHRGREANPLWQRCGGGYRVVRKKVG